jgi:hypothetical protein
MKPVQIGLLMALGAIGGALVMKVTHQPVSDAAAVAESQPPATAPAPVQPAEAPIPEKPSPVTVSVEPEMPKPAKVARKQPPASKPAKPRPVESAKLEPPPTVSAPEPIIPAPAPAAPVAAPPARTEPEYVPPTPKPPEPHVVTLNAGILLPVRLVDGLSSERNQPGDTFTASLDKALVVDGFVIAERGARVEGKVVASDRGGKVKGTSAITVELTRLRTADGQNIAIQTDSFERHAQESHKDDAVKVGGGAALGAIIGAIAGGGKGAAIGAAAGGGAGAGGVLLTRGKPATLPSETRINFRLSRAITVTERP